MAWRAYIVDTITGRILAPIDLPSFSWSVSVSDSSLVTTKDKGVGENEVSGLKLPWTAIPGRTQLPACTRPALDCPVLAFVA